MYLLSNAESRKAFKKTERRIKYTLLGFVGVIIGFTMFAQIYTRVEYVGPGLWRAYIIWSEIYFSINLVLIIISGITLLYYLKKFYNFEYQKQKVPVICFLVLENFF